MNSSSLFLAPHNDDEALFGAFTLLREKPLVVVLTDSWIQHNRGDGISFKQRREETVEALKILGCPAIFAGLRDDMLDEWQVKRLFLDFRNFEKVYAPAIIENGNEQHNLVGQIARFSFENVIPYMTYSKTDLWKNGRYEIVPNSIEVQLKNRALDCYKSQINLPATRPHFDAVRGKSEWYE